MRVTTDTISKFDYPEYDKIVLLKQQITGRAALLIKDYSPEKHSYAEVLEILRTALASIEVQKFNTIKQLSELKLPYHGESFQYFCDMRRIMQSFKTLNIDADDILTYFVYYGLNESFKTQMTMITNTTHPTLQQIIDNFFKANERFELARKSKGKHVRSEAEQKTETNVYALMP